MYTFKHARVRAHIHTRTGQFSDTNIYTAYVLMYSRHKLNQRFTIICPIWNVAQFVLWSSPQTTWQVQSPCSRCTRGMRSCSTCPRFFLSHLTTRNRYVILPRVPRPETRLLPVTLRSLIDWFYIFPQETHYLALKNPIYELWTNPQSVYIL